MSKLLAILGLSKPSTSVAALRASRKAELEHLNAVVGFYMESKK